MLKVKTRIGKSKIEGMGLFAEEFIPKDTVLWEFDAEHDRKYTQEQFDAVSNPVMKSFLMRHCFKFNGAYYLCVDYGIFFNHSNEPNCGSFDYDENSLGTTRAIRDIEPGEELTDDYSAFGLVSGDHLWNNSEFPDYR